LTVCVCVLPPVTGEGVDPLPLGGLTLREDGDGAVSRGRRAVSCLTTQMRCEHAHITFPLISTHTSSKLPTGTHTRVRSVLPDHADGGLHTARDPSVLFHTVESDALLEHH